MLVVDGMDPVTLQVVHTFVVIIAFLAFIDQGVIIFLKLIMKILAFLHKNGATSFSQLQSLLG